MKKSLLTGALALGTLAVGMTMSVDSAIAFQIVPNGTSGGNPGGLLKYDVTGLVAGDSFQVDWLYDAGTDGILEAVAQITVDTFTNTSATLSIMLTNNSTLSTSRIGVFGLSVEDFTGLSSADTGGNLLKTASSSTFPGFQDIVACATGHRNCAAGAGGGILGAGGSDIFSLQLAGNFGNSLTLNSFGIQWQTAGDSYQIPGTPIPTPGAVLPGLIGMGAAAFRKKKQGEEVAQDA